MVQTKTWVAAVIVLLVAGCGGVTPEEIAIARKLAQKGYLEELQALLAEKPAIANAMIDDDCSLLELVVDVRPAYPNMPGTVELLLDSGADPNRNAPEILRKAIWHREPEIFEMLLEHGADPTIVCPKKKVNMIEYAHSKGDARFDRVIEEWEASRRTALRQP